MSRISDDIKDQIIAKFTDGLMLQETRAHHFEAHTPDFGWQHIFGGQLIAQCIIAAQRCIEQLDTSHKSYIHAFHCCFLQPANPHQIMEYDVEVMRSGLRYHQFLIRASQNQRLILTATASFQRSGIHSKHLASHQIKMPDVPPPDMTLFEQHLLNMDDTMRAYFERERPFEILPVSLTQYKGQNTAPYRQQIWLNLLKQMPNNITQDIAAACIGYMSDILFIDTALLPHLSDRQTIFDGSIKGLSLNHTIWFHRPFIFNDWILFDMESPAASSGRGLVNGHIFSRSGYLIASVAQDGLIRKRAKD